MRASVKNGFVAIALLTAVSGSADPCFPLEELPPSLRRLAEHYLSNALAGGAVFTLAGRVKPVSDGFAIEDVPSGVCAEPLLRSLRTVAAAFRCEGRYEAAAVLSMADADGDRRVSLFLADSQAFRRLLRRRQAFFRRLGLGPNDTLEHVLFTVENAAEPARSQALGALYGYPGDAVRFFSRYARQVRLTGEPTNNLRWVRIAGVTGDARFNYAVPRGSPSSAAEKRLREQCALVRASYRRVGYAMAEDVGAAPLPQVFLREWIRREPELFPPADCAPALADVPNH